jgi:hypothetical protein
MTNDLDPDRVSADAHLPSLLANMDDLAQYQRHLNATYGHFSFDSLCRNL